MKRLVKRMILIKKPEIKAKACDNCSQKKAIKSIVIKRDNHQHSITLCKKCRSNLVYLINLTDTELDK